MTACDVQWGGHAGKTKPSLGSSLRKTISLCFQYSQMPCSNLFPEPFRGYYRSFWCHARQEMWSNSSGAMCCSVPAPRDPLCDSQDLCHCPHSTQNNFCCAFFFFWFCFSCLWPFLLNKSTALHLTFLQMLFGNCATGQCWVISSQFLLGRNKSALWVTVAAGIQ